MKGDTMNVACLEKVVEYASMPLHGTLSRKLRKGLSIQINEGRVYEKAVLFLGTDFLRVTEKGEGQTVNTYYGWEEIASIRTYSSEPEE
jgi:hypothetical protein